MQRLVKCRKREKERGKKGKEGLIYEGVLNDVLFTINKKKNRQNKNQEKDVRERIMDFCADELKDGIM